MGTFIFCVNSQFSDYIDIRNGMLQQNQAKVTLLVAEN